jgi:hypothetical protein
MKWGVVAALALIAGSLSACTSSRSDADPACMPPPRTSAVSAYDNFAKLSYLDLTSRVTSQSTSDPGGTNHDSSHVLRTRPDGGHVLLDEVGPGEVTFMRMQEDWGGPWQLQVDDGSVTTIQSSDLGADQPVTGTAALFPYPLSVSPDQGQGSTIVASTIPFRRSVRLTALARNGNFYSLYRRFSEGTPVGAMASGAQLNGLVRLLRSGARSLLTPALKLHGGTATVLPGTETEVLSLAGGPRQLRWLRFRVPDHAKVALGDARLRIYWDGERTPSVDAPLKYVTGDGAGVYSPRDRPLVASWPTFAGQDGDGFAFELLWPMPFHKTARVTLSTPTDLGPLLWQAGDEPFAHPAGWWGTFHATEAAPPTEEGADLKFLDVSGTGRIVGTVVNFGEVGPTLEGDPRIYLDDSNTPQVKATGTEEWAMGGVYWRDGHQTSLPLAGLPSTTANPPGDNVDGSALYRFLVADSIPFNRRAVINWEHGVANTSRLPYRAVVLWYGTPAITALQTDRLDVGDETSRTRHVYTGEGILYSLRTGWEYPVQTGPITRTGISTSKTTAFTLHLDRRNTGAFLRRTFDYGMPDQRARLYIDGEPAGTWYSAGSFMGNDRYGHSRRWRQEELPLPRHLTEGRSSVRIEVRFEPTADPPNHEWTEFEYELYSLVPVGCRE